MGLLDEDDKRVQEIELGLVSENPKDIKFLKQFVKTQSFVCHFEQCCNFNFN